MFIEERHRAILTILQEKGRVSLSDIQEMFSVSVDSARRDLRILEGKGLIKRTHGGAIPAIVRGKKIPDSYTHRDVTDIKANYLAIALKAVSMIDEHDVIHITSGTVGYFMAQHLPRNIEITVVINSIVIAEVLRTYPNVTTILVGGVLNSKGNCTEQLAVDMIKNIRFDKAFLTSAAVSVDFGASIQSAAGCSLIRAFMASAKQKIGLYPNEKIEREAILHICPISNFDTIITDWDTAEEDLVKLRETDVEIIVLKQGDNYEQS